MRFKFSFFLLLFLQGTLIAQSRLIDFGPNGSITLSKEGASYFARLSLDCTGRIYPHHYDESKKLESKEDLKYPEELWPSFYGCFDWHSGVHNHWALVKILKTYPDIPEAKFIRLKLEKSFDAKNMEAEKQYFADHEYPLLYANREFEFPYGRSWLLKVADELIRWNDPDAKRWLNNLRPLTDYIVDRYLLVWPNMEEPVFTGAHYTSSMGISFALDYARSSGHKALEKLMIEKARQFYGDMKNYDLSAEPDQYDFMSCGLLVTDLMRKVYSPSEYLIWAKSFVPDLFNMDKVNTALQIKKTDKHDGYESHWDGFHLNRIWCLNGMLKSIPKETLNPSLVMAWKKNELAMWDYAQSSIGVGNYDIDHWLSSFSVFAWIGYKD